MPHRLYEWALFPGHPPAPRSVPLESLGDPSTTAPEADTFCQEFTAGALGGPARPAGGSLPGPTPVAPHAAPESPAAAAVAPAARGTWRTPALREGPAMLRPIESYVKAARRELG